MNHQCSQLGKIYLKPGELIIMDEPMIVTTVLGSCIAVTMFHPQTGTAAICHAMMPHGSDSVSFKYVDTSIKYMARCFFHRKVKPKEIQVKLFGGADMFKKVDSIAHNLTIGQLNISAATNCLKAHRMLPTASDVGGRKGRKLIFKTDSGIVFIKKQTDQQL